MDRKTRERLLREAVLRAVREFDAQSYDRDKEPAMIVLPRRSPVPDTLRELVEN